MTILDSISDNRILRAFASGKSMKKTAKLLSITSDELRFILYEKSDLCKRIIKKHYATLIPEAVKQTQSRMLYDTCRYIGIRDYQWFFDVISGTAGRSTKAWHEDACEVFKKARSRIRMNKKPYDILPFSGIVKICRGKG
jgi:hypothetical protein